VCQDVPPICVLTALFMTEFGSKSLAINELEPLGAHSDAVRIVL